MARIDAEQQAFDSCVIEWLWQNPPPASGPVRCAHCGQPLGEIGRDGLPFLTGDGGDSLVRIAAAPKAAPLTAARPRRGSRGRDAFAPVRTDHALFEVGKARQRVCTAPPNQLPR